MEYLIVENEIYAKEKLKSMVQEIRPDAILAGESGTIEDTVNLIEHLKKTPDLIFLDIELDDGNCFEIFRRTDAKSPVIFTTAYDNYMLQAFKENGIAYLLKPILKEDLAHALDKLERLKGLSSENQASARMENRRWRQRLLIVNGDQYSFVNVSEIAYLLSEDKYVFAILKSGKRQLTEIGSLADALPCLDRHQFFSNSKKSDYQHRIHRKSSKTFQRTVESNPFRPWRENGDHGQCGPQARFFGMDGRQTIKPMLFLCIKALFPTSGV